MQDSVKCTKFINNSLLMSVFFLLICSLPINSMALTKVLVCNDGDTGLRFISYNKTAYASWLEGWGFVNPGGCQIAHSANDYGGLNIPTRVNLAFLAVDRTGTAVPFVASIPQRNGSGSFDATGAANSPKLLCAPLDKNTLQEISPYSEIFEEQTTEEFFPPCGPAMQSFPVSFSGIIQGDQSSGPIVADDDEFYIRVTPLQSLISEKTAAERAAEAEEQRQRAIAELEAENQRVAAREAALTTKLTPLQRQKGSYAAGASVGSNIAYQGYSEAFDAAEILKGMQEALEGHPKFTPEEMAAASTQFGALVKPNQKFEGSPDLRQKASYAFGANFGAYMASMGLSKVVDFAEVARGLQDAMAGNLKLTPQEIQTSIQEFSVQTE